MATRHAEMKYEFKTDPPSVILEDCAMIYNMNQVFKGARFNFNAFSLILLGISFAAPASALDQKEKTLSISEQAKKMRADRILEMQTKSKELLKARNLKSEIAKELEKPAPKLPSKEEQAAIDAAEARELAAKTKKLTPEQLARVKKNLARIEEAEKKAKGIKKDEKDAGKVRIKESKIEDVKQTPSRTFRKDAGKSPTEYGDSTASPGEAEKDTIEYPKKSDQE